MSRLYETCTGQVRNRRKFRAASVDDGNTHQKEITFTSFNVFLRPFLSRLTDEAPSRIPAIIQYFKKSKVKSEVVAFQEAFNTLASGDSLIEGIKNECSYQHSFDRSLQDIARQTSCCTESRRVMSSCTSQCAPLCCLCICAPALVDSGLGLISTLPLNNQQFIRYGAGNLDDYSADKGFIYTRIMLDETTGIHVFNTHLQATYRNISSRKKCHEMRIQQINILFTEIKRIVAHSKDPIVLLGDFNINGTSHLDAFHEIVITGKINDVIQYRLFDCVEYICYFHEIEKWEDVITIIVSCFLHQYLPSLGNNYHGDPNHHQAVLLAALATIRPNLDHFFQKDGYLLIIPILSRLIDISYEGVDAIKHLRYGTVDEDSDHSQLPVKHSYLGGIHYPKRQPEHTEGCFCCCNKKVIKERELPDDMLVDGEWLDYAIVFNHRGASEKVVPCHQLFSPGLFTPDIIDVSKNQNSTLSDHGIIKFTLKYIPNGVLQQNDVDDGKEPEPRKRPENIYV